MRRVFFIDIEKLYVQRFPRGAADKIGKSNG
jgi:hypothetical protein